MLMVEPLQCEPGVATLAVISAAEAKLQKFANSARMGRVRSISWIGSHWEFGTLPWATFSSLEPGRGELQICGMIGEYFWLSAFVTAPHRLRPLPNHNLRGRVIDHGSSTMTKASSESPTRRIARQGHGPSAAMKGGICVGGRLPTKP